ncbi:MAG: hypothetical protein EOP50_05575 [Sphingobacteriales bacterium]|nr:MAG: hypothetical protein EOP50_05575 [Sphingobacteriales bacterium]
MRINPALEAHVYPVAKGSYSYILVLLNTTQIEIRNIDFNFEELLGPSDFGVDDTYMPDKWRQGKKLSAPILAPGGHLSIEFRGWGLLDKYQGSHDRAIRGKFADGGKLNGHTLTHFVAVAIHLDVFIANRPIC